MISLRDVWLRAHDGRWALRGLDLDLQPGELVGVVGANGAGKTALLRLLATLAEPTRGALTFDGVDAVVWPERVRPQIGYLPPAAAPDGGADETVSACLRRRSVGRALDPATVEGVLDLVELQPRAEALVTALSTGEQRRLDLASALVHDPTWLFLDQPSEGLTRHNASELFDFLLSLAEVGRAIVVASHDAELLHGTCARVFSLSSGQLSDITHGGAA